MKSYPNLALRRTCSARVIGLALLFVVGPGPHRWSKGPSRMERAGSPKDRDGARLSSGSLSLLLDLEWLVIHLSDDTITPGFLITNSYLKEQVRAMIYQPPPCGAEKRAALERIDGVWHDLRFYVVDTRRWVGSVGGCVFTAVANQSLQQY